jgi:lysophospholipase L1-like esterase
MNLWHRIVQIHHNVAVITLNSLILSIGLLILGDWILPKAAIEPSRNIARIGLSTPYSSRFNQYHYYFMPRLEVMDLLREYDLMASEGHWQVHPWTGLTMRNFRGKYLNIDNNGHRLTSAPDATYAEKPPLVIWAFGGSTLFGWGLADDYTLPSQLQLELQSRISSHQVRVLNFGVPLYASSQELALFIAYLRTMKQPDIALFLDGVNDVWYIMYQNDQTPLIKPLAGAWETEIETFTKPNPSWISLNSSFPLNRLMWQLGVNLNPPNGTSDEHAFNSTGVATEDEQLDYAAYSYRYNQQLVSIIGDEFGIATYFFFQPWKDPYYPQFLQKITENNATPHVFDLTDAFANVGTAKSVLVDDFHYSDYGTRILAQKIADILMQIYPLGE